MKTKSLSHNKKNHTIVAETKNLTKIYRIGKMEFPALVDVNIKIEENEFISIVGPSGSGKSTLLNLLGTLDRPTEGSVMIDGVDTSKMDSDKLSQIRNRNIGFIFQSYNLINRTTVLRNLELPAMVRGITEESRRKRANELLGLVGINELASRKPTSLSGGQQQRVAIARALINKPAIILADEPTGNLDSKTGTDIFNLLRKLCRDKEATIIVVTHNLELAEETDRIIKLRDGRVEIQ